MTNTKGRYASLLGPSEAPEAPATPQQLSHSSSDLPANPRVRKSANQNADKSSNQHTDLSENQRSDYRTTPPAGKSTSQQNRKAVNMHAGKRGKKFTSYLSEEAIRNIKWLAIERGVNDYEIFQEAIEQYLLEQHTSLP